MILAIDVGNTNIVLGGHRNNSFIFIARIATDRKLEADQYAVELRGILDLYGVLGEEIDAVVISSVVPSLTKVLKQAIFHFTKVEPMTLGVEDAGSMEICINNPSELGTDMLANAIAVQDETKMPAIIVDIGTATKFIALDENGDLRGVSIAPGPFVSLNALLQNTSLLSSISLDAPENAIGRDTTDSMKSGVVLGAACMIDGMVRLFEKELGGKASLIATGGVAPIIIRNCENKMQFRPNLVLEGLIKAYSRRQRKISTD